MNLFALPSARPLLRKTLLGAALAASAGLVGCADHHYHRYREVDRVTVVEEAPPVVREEVVTVRPSRDHVWISGRYEYVDRRYVWRPGRWERAPHRGAVYEQGRWSHADRGYRWEPGYWR